MGRQRSPPPGTSRCSVTSAPALAGETAPLNVTLLPVGALCPRWLESESSAPAAGEEAIEMRGVARTRTRGLRERSKLT